MADAVIGALRVVLGADSAAFEKQMGDLSSKIGSIGQGLKAVGAGIASYFSVREVVGFGTEAVQAFGESQKAIAAVEAALKSTGGTAGFTSKQLQDMAAHLQSISVFDDDQILSKVTANLLTFGKVSGEAFDRAQLAAVNLSARLGQDLQSSAIQVGKALNDPVKGITALQRVGVSFTEDQKKLIKTLVDTGDVAGAQKVILDELFKEFGGQAEAQAKTVTGAWQQMQNAVGDALEAVGSVLAPYVTMFANFIKSLAQGFTSLSPATQTFIVAIGGVAAVFASLLPVILVIGPALAALGPVIAVIASPVGIVIAAVAALSVALNALGVDFQTQWEVVKIAFGAVVDFFFHQIDLLKALFTGDFAGAWQALKNMITDVLSGIADIIEKLFPGLIASLQSQVAGLAAAFVDLKNRGIQAVSDLYYGVKQWLLDAMNGVINAVMDKINALANTFKELYDKVVGHSYIPDMVTESTGWLKQMGKSMDTLGDTHVARWNANMASMSSANATISTTESASVHAANDNGSGMGRGGRGDIYVGGITLQATDYQSFKQSKGQVQADLSDMVRAAFAGR